VEFIDYWTIFSLNFLKNQYWKLYWNLGTFLVLLESPHQVWFNKVDFVILRPKMWRILLKFLWERIVVGNSNKLQKGVWKESSIQCIQTWANDIRYINVEWDFIIILNKYEDIMCIKMNKHYNCTILLIIYHYLICYNDLHRSNKLHVYWT